MMYGHGAVQKLREQQLNLCWPSTHAEGRPRSFVHIQQCKAAQSCRSIVPHATPDTCPPSSLYDTADGLIIH